MNELELFYDEICGSSNFGGILLNGIIQVGEYKTFGKFTTYDILINGKSLFEEFKYFFEVGCKYYWEEIFHSDFTFAVQFAITYPNSFIYLGGGIYEFINGNKGFEKVMTSNENIFEILRDYQNKRLLLKI